MTETELSAMAAEAGWIQFSGYGKGNGNGVIAESPKQVLLNNAQRLVTDGDGFNDFVYIAIDQHQIGCVNGNTGPLVDRHAQVCCGQRGGIINAIADHGNPAPLLLQAANQRLST